MDDQLRPLMAAAIADDLALFYGTNVLKFMVRSTDPTLAKEVAASAMDTALRIVDKLLTVQAAGQIPPKTPLN